MSLLLKLQTLRTKTRKNGKAVIKNIVANHIQRNEYKKDNSKICTFCSSQNNLTKEHVLPRWVFGNDTNGFFITDVNGLGQTYNKATVPTCSSCNTDLLNALEKCICQLFRNIDLKKTLFSSEEIENIIRWLEIIDYKFNLLDVIKKFKRSKQGGYIHYLADFPISVLRNSVDYSTYKVIAGIRQSQKRITIKRKARHINSLVTFKTSNKGFNFFHQMNDFIFLELPKQQVAIFYFYSKTFNNEVAAHNEAMMIINKFYK